MARICIPVAMVEFEEGGNTIWVHSPKGATVLRIKTQGHISTEACTTNVVSHADVIVKEDIKVCLSNDVE